MAEKDAGGSGALPVVVAWFADEAIAQLAAGLLEADGIEPFIWTRMPGRGLGQREATLSVRPADVDAAKAILRSSPARAAVVD